MNLLKATAVTLTTVTLMIIAPSVANAQSPTYLTGDNLRNAISGQTLIARDWAEFYNPNGGIVGRVRSCVPIFGCSIRDYTGTWTAQNDRICYTYPRQFGYGGTTCSWLTLNNITLNNNQITQITHYCTARDPRPQLGCSSAGVVKNDGIATRYSGNALNVFR